MSKKSKKEKVEDKNVQKDKIQELETKLVEMENNWKRALADYKNLEKRVADDKTNFTRLLKSELLVQLIPLLDNLEMLASHSTDRGVLMIVKGFKQTVIDLGVEEINPTNQQFDPKTMEAIELVSGKKDLVVEVAQRGYKLDHIILKPARVKVGNGMEAK